MNTIKPDVKRLPFHQSVLELIKHANEAEMMLLSRLLKSTKIPDGHVHIIDAWGNRCEEIGWGKSDLGVLEDLFKQQVEAEDKKAAKAQDCSKCKNTGVIITGNNDLPCDCPAGDTALFNVAGVDGQITGKEMHQHFMNNSPEPIALGSTPIRAEDLPGRKKM